jgi:tetratricopeptide (TPR) repeat protein
MRFKFNLSQPSCAVVLCCALLASASLAAQQQLGPPPVDEPAKKALRNHAEYQAYASAVKISDPAQRATALEQFAQLFPRSVAVGQALTEALAAWQEAGSRDQIIDVAKRLLVVEPANIRAMAIVVALDRAKAAQSNHVDAGSIDEICHFSADGLNALFAWQMPAGMTADEFASLRNSMLVIFNGGAGTCALSQNDVAKARDTLSQAVAIDGSDLQNLWQLSIADLESRPVDANGFWYCARAIALAKRGQNQAAATAATEYCNKKYTAYHGSPEGWDPILVAAQSQDALPSGFSRLITSSANPNAMDTPTEPATDLLPQPASPGAAKPATPTSPQQ